VFTVKFSICDNVYPLSRSWNFSSDDKIGSTTRDTSFANHSHWCIDIVHSSGWRTFVRAFIARHELAIENRVYFYSFNVALHYARAQFRSRLRGIDETYLFRDYHRAHHNIGFRTSFRFRANGIHTRPPHARFFHILPHIDSFRFWNRAIRFWNMRSAIVYYRSIIADVWCGSAPPKDSINSLQRCSLAYSSTVLSRVVYAIKSHSMLSLTLSIWLMTRCA